LLTHLSCDQSLDFSTIAGPILTKSSLNKGESSVLKGQCPSLKGTNSKIVTMHCKIFKILFPIIGGQKKKYGADKSFKIMAYGSRMGTTK
jgi:hypothetical protein